MAPPDFSKSTIETLGKRASLLCSNPDCRRITAGATSTEKATIIGEAAHIYGARPKAARFSPQMSDLERAQGTNGIWLCRACHKLIDDDEIRYSPELLFKWREIHDEFTATQLEKAGSWARIEVQKDFLTRIHSYLQPQGAF
ncbi:hypothetical protein [Parasedimentitalea maritima]|uniref:HNH endonuclease n=1 Tax=Parasedimentitalea maritima TaxID=2578117 RepID=A0A6A4RL34_9RHOB|nr:hypothetical protein [Zongyanglinia marina]KAE9630504.1 hypothetical protein GP644_08870 [Zongyanglinia marina]